MSLEADLKDFLRPYDPRGALLELALQEGALVGVAEARLAEHVRGFAARHGLQTRLELPPETPAWLAQGRAKLHAAPEGDAEQVSEALCGEAVTVFDAKGSFRRVRLARDGYLGWLREEVLELSLPAPTHRVAVLRGHAFAAPRVEAAPVLELALGVCLRVEGAKGDWLEVVLSRGRAFVRKGLLEPLDAPLLEPSAASIARLARAFLHTPYLWGGCSAWGLDCSGLVQTIYAAHGFRLPRDTDKQEACGERVASDARAGDLMFLPGHVMIALDADSFVHANAHHMRVTVDRFSQAPYGHRLASKLRGVRCLPGFD